MDPAISSLLVLDGAVALAVGDGPPVEVLAQVITQAWQLAP